MFRKKNINEFFRSNGLILHDFFLFLPLENQSNLGISDSYKFFDFFKKNSELSELSQYFSKITLILKKTIILKGKLSKLLKILLKKQKTKNDQKKKSLKISKINLFFITLENTFSKFERNFLGRLKKNLFWNSYKFLLKMIYFKNKLNFIKKFVQWPNCKTFVENQFFKKKKPNTIYKFNLKIEIYKKKRFFFTVEKYISETTSFFSNFFWKKIVFCQIGNLIFEKVFVSGINFFQKYLYDNKHSNLKEMFKAHFNTDEIKKFEYYKIYNSFYFKNNLSDLNLRVSINSDFIFSRNIYQYKQKVLRLSDQLLYEINFVKKILLNSENNLYKFLGTTISDNISSISELIRKKIIDENRIKGILLDLIAIYRYFEKPVQNLLSQYLPCLIVQDKDVISLIKKNSTTLKNFNLEILVNGKNEPIYFTNIKNSKLLDFNSIIFTNSEFSSLIRSLVGNSFLCIDSLLANKISKFFSITTVTLEGQIFNSNGIISTGFSNLQGDVVHESVMLKKERNFFYWIKDSLEKMKKIEINLIQIHKKKKELQFTKSEILRFLEKKKKHFSTPNNYHFLSSEKILICFLIEIDYREQILSLTMNLGKKRKSKFSKIFKTKIFFKHIELYKSIKKKCIEYFFRLLESKSIDYSGFLNKIKLNYNENGSELRKTKPDIILLKKTIDRIKNSLLPIKKQIYQNYLTFKKPLLLLLKFEFFNEIDISRLYDYSIPKKSLKSKVFYLIKIRKKIQNVLDQQLLQNQKRVNIYTYKLIIFYENLENNLKVLYQMFDILNKEKVLKFKKISKKFSRKFQENLNLISPQAESCLIWKEKWGVKSFKKEIFKSGTYTGLKILIKFTPKDTFFPLECMSKGQICFIFLIFSVSIISVSCKSVFFFDEFDVYMDSHCETLCSKLVKKISSRGVQFFIITHKKKTTNSGDKWYGISKTDLGSLVENITLFDSNKYLSLNS